MRTSPLIAAGLAMMLAGLPTGPVAAAGDRWRLDSGEHRVALVELFTSEGCSSCPPADRWLSKLAGHEDLWSAVVPVAFHVDYWDYIGWADRFARPAFGERQRTYRSQGLSTGVYTPGFVVGGQEWRGWFRGERLDPGKRRAVGSLDLVASGGDFEASFTPRIDVDGPVELHVALLGFGISTRVKAGENHGRTLTHDFVVLDHARFAMRDGGDVHTTSGRMPASSQASERLAVAAWVSPVGSPLPIQAVGGWLP